jgi:hydrogenase maturation protease
LTGRIICLGNRYLPGDDTGPRVFDHLSATPLPDGVRITDGGLAGLNLLSLFEGERRVVLIDALAGFAPKGDVAVVGRQEAVDGGPHRHGHAGGLAYLLAVLPEVCEGEVPEVLLVGTEGTADESTIRKIAERALALATDGEARHA